MTTDEAKDRHEEEGAAEIAKMEDWNRVLDLLYGEAGAKRATEKALADRRSQNDGGMILDK
jgi:hypothetical protein